MPPFCIRCCSCWFWNWEGSKDAGLFIKAEVRQPICKCDKKSASQYQKEVSIEGLDGPIEMTKREARPGAMDVATRWMDQ
jgi:hypothetical protein